MYGRTYVWSAIVTPACENPQSFNVSYLQWLQRHQALEGPLSQWGEDVPWKVSGKGNSTWCHLSLLQRCKYWTEYTAVQKTLTVWSDYRGPWRFLHSGSQYCCWTSLCQTQKKIWFFTFQDPETALITKLLWSRSGNDVTARQGFSKIDPGSAETCWDKDSMRF